jgi:hypothetical protein
MATSPPGLRTVIHPSPGLDAAKAWGTQMLRIEPNFDQTFYVDLEVGGYELGLRPTGDLAAAGGDVGSVNYLIDAGNESAADRLAELAGAQGDIGTLNRLSDEGNDIPASLVSRIIGTTE